MFGHGMGCLPSGNAGIGFVTKKGLFSVMGEQSDDSSELGATFHQRCANFVQNSRNHTKVHFPSSKQKPTIINIVSLYQTPPFLRHTALLPSFLGVIVVSNDDQRQD
jgi:hypothetical protein